MKKFEMPDIQISMFDTDIRAAAETSGITPPVQNKAETAARTYLTAGDDAVSEVRLFSFSF